MRNTLSLKSFWPLFLTFVILLRCKISTSSKKEKSCKISHLSNTVESISEFSVPDDVVVDHVYPIFCQKFKSFVNYQKQGASKRSIMFEYLVMMCVYGEQFGWDSVRLLRDRYWRRHRSRRSQMTVRGQRAIESGN